MGKFTGKLTDCYGKSVVEGFTDHLQISFEKQYYDKDGKRKEAVITYFLLRREYMMGWSGIWTYKDPKHPEEECSGQTFCCLFPTIEDLIHNNEPSMDVSNCLMVS